MQMASQSLKDAYWDDDRKDTLLYLMENFSFDNCPETDLEFCLLQAFETEKFVVENGALKYELVFDSNYIEFV